MGMGMKRCGVCLALCAMMLLAWPAHSVYGQSIEPPRMLQWHCWMVTEPQFNIVCVDEGGDGMASGTPGAEPVIDERQLRSSAPGNDVSTLTRSNPAEYLGRIWTIPLFNLPFDIARVSLLARSVMCGRDPLCAVRMDGAPR